MHLPPAAAAAAAAIGSKQARRKDGTLIQNLSADLGADLGVLVQN